MKRILLALSCILALAVSCNYFAVQEPDNPDVPDNPDTPSGEDPDDGNNDVTPVLSIDYKAVDSLRIASKDFPYWAYDTTLAYSNIILNTLLNKCIVRNDAMQGFMATESGSTTPSWGYWNYIIHYTSKDASGKDVTLSERVVFPSGFDFSHSPRGIALINHPTIGANRECPTVDKDYLMGLAAKDYVAVFPDLLGFGVSQERVHPYLCEELTARTTLDGVLAAQRFLSDRGITLRNEGLVNVGYSQGGASALAVHKYVETRSTDAERDQVHLRASYCGGGPYDLIATWDSYKQADVLSFPAVLPMTILGLKEGFPQEMKDIDLYDCFSEAVREKGFLEYIVSKKYPVTLLNAHLKLAVGSTRMSDILSPAMQDETTDLAKTVRSLLERNNLITGWAPGIPVHLYHEKYDDVVPYVNMEKALKGLAGGVVLTINPILSGGSHVGGAGIFYLQIMEEL